MKPLNKYTVQFGCSRKRIMAMICQTGIIYVTSVMWFLLCACTNDNLTKPVREGSILMKVSGNGLMQESYILGTQHGDGLRHSLKDVSLESVSIENIVDKVDVVVTEVSHDLQDSSVVSDCRKAYSMVLAYERADTNSAMPSNKSYIELYNDRRKYELMHFHMIDTLNMEYYQSRQPIYWALRIAGLQAAADKNEEYSLDRCVADLARQRHKSLRALETYSEQAKYNIARLKNCPYYGKTLEMQAEMLYRQITNGDVLRAKTKQYYDSTAYHYRRNNIEEMMSQDSAYCDKMTPVERYMFDKVAELCMERNKKWMPRIKKYISDRRCLIAVGYKHLYGEQGLANLLSNEGYELTPIF